MNAAAPGWYPDPEHPAMARWWDGATWTDNRAPATPPRKPRNTTAIVLIVVGAVVGAFVLVGVLAAVAIPVFLNQQHKGDLSALRALTCNDVATEAVEWSQDSVRGDEIPLTSTNSMILVTDARASLRMPAGTGEVFVMKCSGRGQWADGATTPLVVDLYTNAHGDHLFSIDWDI